MNVSRMQASAKWPTAAQARIGALIVCAAAAINALLFSNAVATPLVQADAWYFITSFLTKYYDGALSVFDLFVQRSASDHAQPIQKILLLLNAEKFDLDFRIEGLIGTLAGIAWVSVLCMAIKQFSDQVKTPVVSWLTIAATFCVGLSLNSTNIFSWPLATLGYIPHLICTGYFIVLARRASPLPLVVAATFLLGMTTDEVAILAIAASAVALLGIPSTSWPEKAKSILAMLLGIVFARVALWAIAAKIGVDSSAVNTSLGSLKGVLNTDALTGILIPLSDSLIHAEQFERFFPGTDSTPQVLFGILVAVLNVFFWLHVAVSIRRRSYDRLLALAVFLMLFSYALTLGTLVSRVPEFGWNYLHQPRYVQFYQLCPIALAIGGLHLAQHLGHGRWRRKTCLALVISYSVALILLQAPLSNASWKLPPYLNAYWAKAASAMSAMAANPAQRPQDCPDILYVCDYENDARLKAMSLLRDHKLNLFSESFQRSNRLYPTVTITPVASAPRQLLAPAAFGDEPALIHTTIEPRCTEENSRAVKVEVDVRALGNSGFQVWAEAPGSPRAMLRNIPQGLRQDHFQMEIFQQTWISVVRTQDALVIGGSLIPSPGCR